MKVKVFYVDPQSYNNLALYDYSLLVNNTSFDITFFGNSLYPYKNNKKIDFVALYGYSVCKNKFIKIFSYIYSCIKLILTVLIIRPKLIHIQWIKLWYVDYCFVWVIKLFSDIKILYTAHNVLPHETGNSQSTKYKKYYHLVDSIITHTQRSKDDLIKIFELPSDKISVIPHGVLDYNLDHDLVLECKKKIQALYSLNNKLVFSVLGQQSSYKGSDIIAEVWAKTPLLHDYSKYRLLIFGKNLNIDFSVLEGIDNVFIEDRFVSDEEFNALLKITDVLILPYRAISQSGVLLSAINESVPILVSDVGGLTEPLSIGNIGWNMGSGTFENLQTILFDIVCKENDIYNKKANKIEWDKVKSYYAWNAISKKTFDLYKALII